MLFNMFSVPKKNKRNDQTKKKQCKIAPNNNNVHISFPGLMDPLEFKNDNLLPGANLSRSDFYFSQENGCNKTKTDLIVDEKESKKATDRISIRNLIN